MSRLVIVGQRFHTGTIMGRAGKTRGGHAVWRWECDCGEVHNLRGAHISQGHKPDCNCAVQRKEADPEARACYVKLLRRVATASGLDESVIHGRSRLALPVAARHVIAAAMKAEGFSLSQIGLAMRREHSSVLRQLRGGDPMGRLASLLRDSDMAKMTEAVSRWRDEMVIPVTKEDDKILYQRVVAKLVESEPEKRFPLWEAACRQLFPHSWAAQSAMLPCGLHGTA